MKAYESELRAFEKRYLLRLAEKFDWNVSRMIEFSGIGRASIYRMFLRNDIEPPTFDKEHRTRVGEKRATH